MSQSIYVVTGALGFVGFNLSIYLSVKGHKVIGLDKEDDNVGIRNWRKQNLISNGIDIFESDISNKYKVLDFENKIKVYGQVKSIFHLAGLAGVRKSLEIPSKYYDANLRGTLNIIQLALRSNIPSLVFSSTSSVYGDNIYDYGSKETDPKEPISPYANSKLLAEKVCELFSDTHDLNLSIVRYFTVYGPAGRPDMSILRFIDKIFKGKKITIFGDGSQKRDFTYIDDICEGTFLSSESSGFNTFNLGRSEPVKLIEIVRLIEEISNKKADIEFAPANSLDVNKTFADIERAKNILGWKPNKSVKRGLLETFEWYRNNIDSIGNLE